MACEEILIEIDETLDQLILNAEVLQDVDFKQLSETEISAFQKTQESLLQHLLHMDQHLVAKRESLKIQDKRSAQFKIQEKRLKFEKMKNDYQPTLLSQLEKKVPILSKRRSKRWL